MGTNTRIIVIVAVVVALIAAFTFFRPGVYANGSFEAVSQADNKGYAWARVTIQRDRICSVELKEITEKIIEKNLETYPWPEAREANETLARQFVERNTWDVDTVAKATSSSQKYKNAVKLALERARRTPATTTIYFDGQFLGKSEADAHGYAVAWVTLANDQITDVRLDEITEQAEFKDWDNYPWPQAAPAREEMTNRLKAATPATVGNVDVVATVTSSSEKWKTAVQNALASARAK